MYWGIGEPAPKELLNIFDKVHQKLVVDLPHRPFRAHYVVGGGVQDVYGGIVVHDEGVVTCRPQIVRTIYQGGALVPKDELNTFKYWLTVGFPGYLTTLPSKEVFVFFLLVDHTWWYWCIFWMVEYEVAWGGFCNNPTLNEVVHKFGQQFCHPTYVWVGAQFQRIYRTKSLEWSSPFDWAHEGSTILVLHVWWRHSNTAIWAIVHNARF